MLAVEGGSNGGLLAAGLQGECVHSVFGSTDGLAKVSNVHWFSTCNRPMLGACMDSNKDRCCRRRHQHHHHHHRRPHRRRHRHRHHHHHNVILTLSSTT